MFIFKIFDQALDQSFELSISVIKNKLITDFDDRLFSPWEIRIYFSIPTMSDLSNVDITAIVYREIKKSDVYNTISLDYGYDHNKVYCAEIITFENEPIAFRKMFQLEGSHYRPNLLGDIENQEKIDEYTFIFKDIKYLDTFIEKMKTCLRDSSQANITLESLKS